MEVNGNYQILLPNGHAEPPEVERAPLSETLIKSPRSRALPAPFAIDRQANEVGSAINAESSLRRRLWSHMDQSAGIRVFQQPQRTVGRLFHIANTFADIPALGRLGSTLPSKMMRFSVFVARPLIKPLPSHCGKVLVPW